MSNRLKKYFNQFCTKFIPIPFIVISLTGYTIELNIKHSEYDSAIQERITKEKDTRALLELAWIYYLYKGDTDKAIEYANRVLAISPVEYEAHKLLRNIYRMRGEYTKMFDHTIQMLKNYNANNILYLYDLITLPTADPLTISSIPDMYLSKKQLNTLEKELNYIIRYSTYHFYISSVEWLLGLLYKNIGKLNKAEQIFNRIGFVTDWLIIGPFDNKDKIGFDEVYPPEEEIDLNKEYEGLRVKVKWTKLNYTTFEKAVPLKNFLYPNEWVVAYALTYIYSPKNQPVTICFGLDDAGKIWLNDNLVFADSLCRKSFFDQHKINVTLNSGWNKLLVKICQEESAWEFILRITDTDGKKLQGIKFSTEIQKYKPETTVNTYIPYNYYTALLTKITNESELYNVAEMLLHNGLYEEAIKYYESLLKQNTNCAKYHFDIAMAYFNTEKPVKAVQEIKKAIQIDTKYIEARYRLGEYYYQNKLYEKAQEEFAKAIELNSDFIEGHFGIARIAYTKNRIEYAYKTIKQLTDKGFQSAIVYTYIGSYAFNKKSYKEAMSWFKKALIYQPGYTSSRDWLISCYTYQDKPFSALKEYVEKLKYDSTDINTYLNIADCYLNGENCKKAINTCLEALKISPQNYAIYTKLGEIYYRLNDTDTALKYWTTALTYKPDYVWLRDYIQFLFPKKNIIFVKYALSEEERKKLLSTTINPTDYPKASAVVLLDRNITQVFQDGSYTELVHYIVKVLNEDGKNRYSKVYIPETGTTKVLKAVTITPQGEEIESTAIIGNEISFSAVVPGAIVEYKYTIDHFEGSWLKGHYSAIFFFQSDEPTIKSEFILAVPKEKQLKIFTQNGDIIRKVEEVENNTVYTWQRNNIEQVHSENYSPPFRDIASLVYVTTIPSWDYFAQWENSLIKDQFDTDKAIKEKVQELTKDKQTLEDKIRAIYNFIVSEIGYLQTYEKPIFGIKPHKATTIFANKYGDCKDKATLMIAMLKEIGVTAYYAIIRTRDYGKLIKEVPAQQMNHCIVYIPSINIFLDGTAQYLSYGNLWHYDQGVDAFVLTPERYEFIRTPLLAAQENQFIGKKYITLFPESNINASAESIETGLYAAYYRDELNIAGQQKESLEKAVNKYVPGAKILSYDITGIDNLNIPLTIKYTFAVDNFAKKDGKKLSFRPMHRLNLTEIYADKTERIYDLFLPYCWSNTITEEYILPEDYILESIPENITLTTPFGIYIATYHIAKNKVRIEKKFSLDTTLIKQKDYTAFRQFCLDIDHHEEKHITIIRKKHSSH